MKLWANVFIFFFLFLSSQGFCAEIIAEADLIPVGSLQIKSEAIGGKITYDDSQKMYSSKRLYIKTSDLTSGIDLRDKHIHEFLKGEEFKYVELRDVQASKGEGQGKLFVAGAKKDIQFQYKRSEESLVAEFQVGLDDLDLQAPSFMGVRPKREIRIKVRYELSKILRLK